MTEKTVPRRSRWGAVGLLLAVGSLARPGVIQAATQTLTFPEANAWYFVSLQIEPDKSDPLDVFPSGVGGFDYDHLWTYVPAGAAAARDAYDRCVAAGGSPTTCAEAGGVSESGWQHFSPTADPTVQAVLIDLDQIEGRRGYWIHVTAVAPGGSEIVVEGTPNAAASLVDTDWNAVGLASDPSVGLQSVSQAIGLANADRVMEVWRYQPGGADEFQQVLDLSANCVNQPGQCVQPGEAYWVRARQAFDLGGAMSVRQDCVVLSQNQPVARIDLKYVGGGTEGAALELSSADGLTFHPNRPIVIDGAELPRPDLTVAVADDPGDGCVQTCTVGATCAPVCFDRSGEQTVFVAIDEARLATISKSTRCDGSDTYAEIALKVGGEVVRHVGVAVQPTVLRGEYAGTLQYEGEGLAGVMPIALHLDDCNSAGTTCGGTTIGAIANPIVRASNRNALDDDLDGEIDEADEQGRLVPLRDSPGLPPEATLFGTASASGEYFRLEGEVGAGDSLSFAYSACSAGQCPNGDPCAFDGDCVAEDGGLASHVAPASRLLVLEGVREDGATLRGIFRDSYVEAGVFEGRGRGTGAGTFVLRQVAAPRCIAVGTSRAVPFDMTCRDDRDCPSRCVGGAAEGLPCGDGQPSCGPGSTCGPRLRCGLRELAPSSGNKVRTRMTGQVFPTSPPDRRILIELSGCVDAVGTVAPGATETNFTGLPCCTYQVRISAAGCEDVLQEWRPCEGSLNLSALACSGPPTSDPSGVDIALRDGSGSVVLRGSAVASTSPVSGAADSLRSVGGEFAVFGVGVSGPSAVLASLGSPVIRTGLVPLLE